MLKKQEMYVIITKQSAGVMELVDVLDSKSSVFGRAGSSPATGTINSPEIVMISGLFAFCLECKTKCRLVLTRRA